MTARRHKRRRRKTASRGVGDVTGHRQGADRAVAIAPTPETAAKLKRDLVDHLRNKGRLSSSQAMAAEEVRRIWQAFSRILGPSATNHTTLATGRQSKGDHARIDWLTDVEETIWRERYRPWAAEMTARPCGGTIRVTQFQIVLEIVVDNRSLRQTEGFYRMRHGAAFDVVSAALRRYAEIAGWVEISH